MCESVLPTEDCCHDHYMKPKTVASHYNGYYSFLNEQDEVTEFTVMQLANGISYNQLSCTKHA